MIISHRHRFIFMHCRKAAGSSIAAALAPSLGDDDLHLGTWPEAFERGVPPNARAWKDLLHPLAAPSFIVRGLRRPSRWLRRDHWIGALNGAQRLKYRRDLGHSPEHAHAARVARSFPRAWRDYFKFCFVRNPFDRAVSDFVWRTTKTGQRRLGFGEFLEAMKNREFTNRAVPRHFDNWPIYTLDDRIAVDFVGRFERLEADLAEAFRRIGLPAPELAHSKDTGRRNYRDFYGPREKTLVEGLFARELEAFGYEF